MNKKESADKMISDAIRISLWGEANPGDLEKRREFIKAHRRNERRGKIRYFLIKAKMMIVFILKKIGIQEKWIPSFRKERDELIVF